MGKRSNNLSCLCFAHCKEVWKNGVVPKSFKRPNKTARFFRQFPSLKQS
jgi:hypothetical protein